MRNRIFSKCDFLIPAEAELEKWSVIACDQFTSEIEYWDEVQNIVGDSPSTLRLMLPEAYLQRCDAEIEAEHIKQTMRQYVDEGVFQVVESSFIYVERILPSGRIRRGLIGALDLEQYEYARNADSLIRATEGAVPDRLPPRVLNRQNAPLEMPHVVVFIDDPEHTVIDPIIYKLNKPDRLYDFDLMMGGGHITGWRVCDKKADDVENALGLLGDPELLIEKYHIEGKTPVIFAVGDGNHSLAAARICWEQIRETLTEEERRSHPARYSMVELVNIHDTSIIFESIDRLILGTDTSRFFEKAHAYFAEVSGEEDTSYTIELHSCGRMEKITINGLDIAGLITACGHFARDYIKDFGGSIDYVHDNAAAELGVQAGNAGIVLPAMKKTELFPTIIRSGAFPRKSFSIGTAREKRYYLECRRIERV